MSEPDVWGAIVPAWLGGVGGMLAAVVSTIALIKSIRTQGGVQTLKKAANSAGALSSGADASFVGSPGPSEGLEEEPASTFPSPTLSPVSWTAWHESRSKYRLRNDSTNNGATATLTGFEDVTPEGDGAASYAGPLPVELAAGESVPFSIEKTIVSPSVTAIGLTWNDLDGIERQRTIYI